MKLPYLTCCVASDADSINDMTERARPVSIATFRRRCDTAEWEQALGYAIGQETGIRLATDPFVACYASHYQGRRCYYIDHSRIEHIFAAA